MNHYAEAKSAVIAEIKARALAARPTASEDPHEGRHPLPELHAVWRPGGDCGHLAGSACRRRTAESASSLRALSVTASHPEAAAPPVTTEKQFTAGYEEAQRLHCGGVG